MGNPYTGRSKEEDCRADRGAAHYRTEKPRGTGSFLVGTDVYEKLIKGYTEKQWGRDCKELPAFIIKRLPLRFIYDNNYFNDRYQGIPIGGYTAIVEKMLDGVDVLLDTDYFAFVKEHADIAPKTVFTGMIDEFYGFKLGVLEYRTVRFETEELDCENYQGNAVVNYTDREVPYTRIIEHKHFEFGKQPTTVISWNIPRNGKRAMSHIIQSTTIRIMNCIRNTKNWQTRRIK